MTEPFSTLLKASEVAKSFLTDLGSNIPFILGSLAASIFISFIPDSLLPTALHKFSGVFMTVGIFILFYFLSLWWVHTRKERQSKWFLNHLATDEKVVLAGFLRQKKAVGYFSIENGAVLNLVNKGILTFAVQTFTRDNVPIAIHPLFFDILCKKPELIGLKPEEIGTEKPEKARPRFPQNPLSQL